MSPHSELFRALPFEPKVLEAVSGLIGSPFVLRFNRRRSRSRGMVFYRVLELAVAHEPMRYQDLIASQRPKKVPPVPPKRSGHSTSLEHPRAKRPWKSAEPQIDAVK